MLFMYSSQVGTILKLVTQSVKDQQEQRSQQQHCETIVLRPKTDAAKCVVVLFLDWNAYLEFIVYHWLFYCRFRVFVIIVSLIKTVMTKVSMFEFHVFVDMRFVFLGVVETLNCRIAKFVEQC